MCSVHCRKMANPLRLQRAVEVAAPSSGHIVEVSGAAARRRFTTAVSLLIHAQSQGEPCGWIQRAGGRLSPPDLVAWGADLSALVVIHIPESAPIAALPRASELLLRSGAFGLVVVDLIDGTPRGEPGAWQGRLGGLAREHESIVILLSGAESGKGSLGPLVSIRIAPERRRVAAARFS